MRFKYKKQIEEDFYKNIILGIISPKKKAKEKGLLERMIEEAVVRQRTIDALRAIGINSNPDIKQDINNYCLSKYQN